MIMIMIMIMIDSKKLESGDVKRISAVGRMVLRFLEADTRSKAWCRPAHLHSRAPSL